MENKLLKGDNIELLKSLEDNSVDSIVTDPPYGLSFMGKKWDYDVPSVEFWKEVYRVLKPGGHILSFGGTRTYHRMVVNIEDGGFEIRDQIMWLYGSGFPKSHNIGKAVDKKMGNKREVVGERIADDITGGNLLTAKPDKMIEITKGNSPYEGFGTGLKPANEPICLARKPFKGTVVDNVLEWKTGGINIDGCRVGETGARNNGSSKGTIDSNSIGYYKPTEPIDYNMGRFPANIILECCCDEVIKGEKGEVKKTTRDRKYDTGDSRWDGLTSKQEGIDNYNDKGDIHTNPNCPCYMMDEQSGGHNDAGGASRFFYQAKVSKKERNMGVEDKNIHPTVKPVSLMTYLVRLITPPNGIVLDPFMGSGSTGIASNLEGFNFIGMEMDEEYFKIAETRINDYENYKQFLK